MQDFAATLRRAITASGKTQLALAEESGVAQTKISRLMAGHQVDLANASKLATALGLELRPAHRRRSTTRRT